MPEAPTRLKPKRTPLLPRRNPDGSTDSMSLSPNFRPSRALRAIRRVFTVLIWTLLAMLVQAVLLFVPGRAKVGFARFYWSTTCWLMGLRVRSIGRPARHGPSGRPVVFVSNHSSWLDILVLGGRLEACFISKKEVVGWPIIGVVARLGRTVFVARNRTTIGRERHTMQGRLTEGDNLILFPEGTSSDGSRVLPFRTAFFSLADYAINTEGLPPLIQPVSLVYDRLAYLPTGRATRPVFAWFGDMSLAQHVWNLAQFRGLRATLLLHAPIDPRNYPDRKALAQSTWAVVADGAATLRQNRPARPIGAGAADEQGSTVSPGTPRFA